IGLLLCATAVISSLLKVPNIRLKSYDMSGMGKIALMSGLVALVSAGLHEVADLPLSGGSYVMFGIVYFLVSAASRVVMLELLLAMYRRVNPRCRVLIYGAGTTGTQLARALAAPETIETVAFVDDNSALQGLSIMGLPVMRPTDIAAIVAEKQVDR